MSGVCFWIKVRDVAWPSSQLAFTFANSVTELDSSTMFEVLVGFERILSRIIIKKKGYSWDTSYNLLAVRYSLSKKL